MEKNREVIKYSSCLTTYGTLEGRGSKSIRNAWNCSSAGTGLAIYKWAECSMARRAAVLHAEGKCKSSRNSMDSVNFFACSLFSGEASPNCTCEIRWGKIYQCFVLSGVNARVVNVRHN